MLFVVSGSLLRRSPSGVDLVLGRDIGQLGLGIEAWEVLSPRGAVVAVLTADTIADVARVPGAAHSMLLAQYAQMQRGVELRAIVATYDVRKRIVRFFEYLARRVGRPEGAAMRIPLVLKQSRVEQLLGAGHTQANTAFRSLAQSGSLRHDAHGWLLFAAATERAEASLLPSSAPNPIVDKSRSVANTSAIVAAEPLPFTPPGP
jgi:hypothetical protein